jgi:hypothetical protein
MSMFTVNQIKIQLKQPHNHLEFHHQQKTNLDHTKTKHNSPNTQKERERVGHQKYLKYCFHNNAIEIQQ